MTGLKRDAGSPGRTFLQSVRRAGRVAAAVAALGALGALPGCIGASPSPLVLDLTVTGTVVDAAAAAIEGATISATVHPPNAGDTCGGEPFEGGSSTTTTASDGTYGTRMLGVPTTGAFACLRVVIEPPAGSDLASVTVDGIGVQVDLFGTTEVVDAVLTP